LEQSAPGVQAKASDIDVSLKPTSQGPRGGADSIMGKGKK